VSSTNRAPIAVEEYLTSVYKPDCDYVDGEVLERNWGELDHSRAHAAVAAYFFARRTGWDLTVLMSVRIQVKPTRFRIPDVCVLLGDTDEQILTKPPFLCIEILSPEDRWVRVNERISDFLVMGVPYVWVIDPQTKQAYIATAEEGLREATDGILRTENPAFHVPLSEFLSQ
jgi:Uma2 family endonuclease